MIRAWLGSLDGFDLGTDNGNLLWLWDGKPLGTTLGDLDEFTLGKYDGAELIWSEGSIEVTVDGDLEGMLLWAWQHLEI